MRWIRWIVVLAVIGGCARAGPERSLRVEGPRMVDLYRGGGLVAEPAREKEKAAADCREGWRGAPGRRRWRRCAEEAAPVAPVADGVNVGFTRDAGNELELLFPRVANPDIMIYVYPHLATASRVPVPGYTTAIPLFDRVEYALPGDFPDLRGAAWPAGRLKRVRLGEFPMGQVREEMVEVPVDAQEEAGDEPADEPDEVQQDAVVQDAEAQDVAEGTLEDSAVPDPGETEESQGGEAGADDVGLRVLEALDAALAGEKEAGTGEDLDAGVDEAVETGSVQAVAEGVETAVLPLRAEEDPTGLQAAGYEVLVNGVRSEDCDEVSFRRGLLSVNARRLLGQCGYRLGSWPGDADSRVDWVIADGFDARVDGIGGLLELIGGYGLEWSVSERDRRVDFRRREG